MDAIIRKRELKDSEELAHNIAVVWNTTYHKIVDEDFLKSLFDNEKDASERLKNNLNEQPFYYVLTLQDKIIGWIYFDLTSNLEDAAEIHALYVLKEYQGNGYGKLLYNFALKEIKKHKIKKLVIGCLEGNPANNFYQHLGGKKIGNNLFRGKYLENIYLFDIK